MPTTKTRSSVRTRGTRTENGRSAKSPATGGKATRSENGSTNGISQLEKLFTDSLKDIYWS